MIIEKLPADCDVKRVMLADGVLNNVKFIIGAMLDGTGVTVEFENGDSFIIKTTAIMDELVKQHYPETEAKEEDKPILRLASKE